MKRRITVALAAMSLVGASALAQEPGPSTPQPVTPPQAAQPLPLHWERMPTGDDFAALYPAAARAQGVGGKVRMTCTVRKDGRMADCIIISETPPNLGFGAATLALARYFKIAPPTKDGQSGEGGTITIPITWAVAR